MQTTITKSIGAVALGMMLSFSMNAQASDSTSESSTHNHDHQHSADDISHGLFDDSQIEARTLADWQGDWQSVYPFLLDGTLNQVMEHKAEHGERTAEEYHDYYATGYQTEVQRIVISGESVTFHEDDHATEATYGNDGYEILTYESGSRGVRYIFTKTAGDETAPQFIQFSDHLIAPSNAAHYHLYWGDDRTEILSELTNWPTYFPSNMSGEEIAHEMMAH